MTSGLRVSVQPAKPASPIRFLYEQLPNVYVLYAYKMFMTFCAPFRNGISHFKILAMPYIYVLCLLLTRIQGSLAFPVVGITFLILRYSKAKITKMVRFHTVTLFSFDFFLHILKFSLATYYVAYFFSQLDVPW